MLQGPQTQVVGVALIIEFCDHNVPFLKSYFSNLVKTCGPPGPPCSYFTGSTSPSSL